VITDWAVELGEVIGDAGERPRVRDAHPTLAERYAAERQEARRLRRDAQRTLFASPLTPHSSWIVFTHTALS
jgi:hypothetical protein